MAVNDVDLVERAGHHQVAEHRVEELLVPRILGGEIEPGALTLAMSQPGRAKEVIEWGPERR